MLLQIETPQHTLPQAILFTLAYADVFDYPLTAPEIHRYLSHVKSSMRELTDQLQIIERVSREGSYFTFRGREALVAVRERRQPLAAQLWRSAIYYGHLMSHLPFIRMVAVTGSLAMNNVEKAADIDYLIITEPGYLWLCRGLVLLLSRLAAWQGVSLCPNYFLTTRALKLAHHDLYTAHELTQMIPLSGFDIYDEMRQQNRWTDHFLPNALGHPVAPIPVHAPSTISPLRRFGETVLRTPFGNWLEEWEMQRKVRKLSREQADSPESGFSKDFCKGHNHRHNERTRFALQERLKALAVEFDL